MKLNCLCCGFKIDLDEAYDDYEGQVKCYVCGGLLAIRAQEGKFITVYLLPHAIECPESEFRCKEKVA
jgi:hypothetical protein